MYQNMKFANKFRVLPLLSSHVKRVRFLDDKKFVKQNGQLRVSLACLMTYISYFIRIYVYFPALGGYVCLSVIGVFHWGLPFGH